MRMLEFVQLLRKQTTPDEDLPIFVELPNGELMDVVDVYALDPDEGFEGKLILFVGDQEVI